MHWGSGAGPCWPARGQESTTHRRHEGQVLCFASWLQYSRACIVARDLAPPRDIAPAPRVYRGWGMAPVPAGRHRHIRAFSPRFAPQIADTGDEDLLPTCAPNHTRNQDMHQRHTRRRSPQAVAFFQELTSAHIIHNCRASSQTVLTTPPWRA